MMGTKRAAVTGWPVDQSRSPIIHGYWLDKLGIDGSYERIAVEPSNAEAFYRSFCDTGLTGCNVTVPHKETAALACDWLDPVALAMGAANTLWLSEDGKLCGANTDGLGFLANLDQVQPGWDSNKNSAIVLGAGGAARAIVWSLLHRGFRAVHIVNRTVEKALQLRDEFGAKTTAHGFGTFVELLGTADLLVNTTALGMTGKPPLNLDLAKLPKNTLVTDIVYVPLETELLRTARLRGNRTVNGLGMLLHQAVPGFERWFGQRPVVDQTLYDLIVTDLETSK
ncbi:shikimate dehydrogenase [Roseibium hamelinense]|uniref:Shikimate dehydrogenase (NADP(+)) n=1 Tax=Roseibium hamelinense TaxID=150831 RepID=A0A562SPD7_9HYPH|nr:shikimate dehydrogenase [Roseibium hamelinense]MTI44400.1 shikimate dehydrogenase [Roseibium hamelinense]TWI82824.1 shikimate dehydrogenase [Roseibium hamelinense]